MKIYTKSLLYGAKNSKGTTILIDVFRGSTTIGAMLAGGTESIYVVKTLKDARQLKKENPDFELIGEMKGLCPKGFNCGNSPYEVSKLDLKGKTIIFRSSAATRGIIYAQEAGVDELLVGSFSNATAIVNYIKEKNLDTLTLIGIGTYGFGKPRKAVEDDLCAEYIKKLLEGGQPDFSQMIEEIKKGDGYKRLLGLGQEKDKELCLTLDLYDIVPVVVKKRDRIIIQKLR
jgi:2-phosphosulfolactate phosphatase